MTFLAWVVLVGAAILEVGGDAIVRKGFRGSSLPLVLAGCTVLGGYGIVVVKWDLLKLLGICVADLR